MKAGEEAHRVWCISIAPVQPATATLLPREAALAAGVGCSLLTSPESRSPNRTIHAILAWSPGTPLQSHGGEELPMNTQTSRGSSSMVLWLISVGN